IFDEIQTGMGRTGTLWAFEQEGVVPDILLLAKAFGAGLPLGAFITDREIMAVLARDPILGHLTTFGGHPLSCAASLAALKWMEEVNLMADVRATGDKLRQAFSSHPAVRQVRGRGLMLALDLRDPDHLLPVIAACRR